MAREMNHEALEANLRMLDKRGEMAFEQARAAGALSAAQEKFSALISDEAFMQRLFAADSTAEAQALFSENGVEMSQAEVDAFGKFIVETGRKLIENGGELSEAELAEIAGGAVLPEPTEPAEGMGSLIGILGGAAGGLYVGMKAGGALGSMICPGFGTAIGLTVGGVLGGIGGVIGGEWTGYGIVKGARKLGGWIKSWF